MTSNPRPVPAPIVTSDVAPHGVLSPGVQSTAQGSPVFRQIGTGRQGSSRQNAMQSSMRLRKIHSKHGDEDHLNFEIDILSRSQSFNARGAVTPGPRAPSQTFDAVDSGSEIISEEEFDLDEENGTAQNADPAAPIPVHDRPDFKFLVMFGCFLTIVSGFLNVVSIKSAGQTVTHVTGSTSNAARTLIEGDEKQFGNLCLLLGSFMVGSMTSGAAVGTNKFVLGHRYGVVIVFVGLLMLAGTLILRSEDEAAGMVVIGTRRMAGLALWAFASGLQNAMCTSFSGAVIRTTHCTGMLTDIGMVLGHILRSQILSGEPAGDSWKLRVLVPQYLSYFVGGLLAAWGHEDLELDMAFFPAGAMIGVGLMYMVLQQLNMFDDFLVEERIEEEIAEVERKVVKALHSIYHQPSHVRSVHERLHSRTDAGLESARATELVRASGKQTSVAALQATGAQAPAARNQSGTPAPDVRRASTSARTDTEPSPKRGAKKTEPIA